MGSSACSNFGRENAVWPPENLCVFPSTRIQRITILLAMKTIHVALGAVARKLGQALYSHAVFRCIPINTSTICLETICIFGKISQCWHKSTLYTPPPRLTALSPLFQNVFPLLNLSLPETGRKGKRGRGTEKWRETWSERRVPQRPLWSLRHYGIHQNPHIHAASKGLLSHKEEGFGKIGGICGLAGGIELGVVYLAPTSPSLELWTFF